jgi:cytochrome c oxidase assembly protein subunit 11
VTRRGATAVSLAGIVFGMLGLSFASVPLYRLFCQVTGYGGTTQRAETAPGSAGETLITVRFNADSAADLGWEFRPIEREVRVRPGEERIIAYRAVNRTSQPITGNATFNVTPLKAGVHFVKVHCFCFEEQRLMPGESVDMPVSFFVDPALLEDPATREIRTITLSYTMFRAKSDHEVALVKPE